MTYQQSFVHHGTWDDETRSDHAMKWMEWYTNLYDTKDYATIAHECSVLPYTLVKSDGTELHIETADELEKEEKALYQAFTEYVHVPTYLSSTETEYGWEMIGQAWVYGNLPGEEVKGEPEKVKDDRGKSWDVRVPAAFRFQYVKDSGAKHDGIKMRRMEICSDSLPVVMVLAKRGVIKLG